VTLACNPGYSGGRDQEDHSSKSAQANSSQDPISKKPITKNGLVEWFKVLALSSIPSMAKKRKKKKKVHHTSNQVSTYSLNNVEAYSDQYGNYLRLTSLTLRHSSYLV
jgi:hypothetical protein